MIYSHTNTHLHVHKYTPTCTHTHGWTEFVLGQPRILYLFKVLVPIHLHRFWTELSICWILSTHIEAIKRFQTYVSNPRGNAERVVIRRPYADISSQIIFQSSVSTCYITVLYIHLLVLKQKHMSRPGGDVRLWESTTNMLREGNALTHTGRSERWVWLGLTLLLVAPGGASGVYCLPPDDTVLAFPLGFFPGVEFLKFVSGGSLARGFGPSSGGTTLGLPVECMSRGVWLWLLSVCPIHFHLLLLKVVSPVLPAVFFSSAPRWWSSLATRRLLFFLLNGCSLAKTPSFIFHVSHPVSCA